MAVTEIKIGGFGGQGVILAGIIIGKAAALFDDQESTMTQAFGPEARGSACSAQVVVSPEQILYPYVTQPDILVVMNQDAFKQYASAINPAGTLVIEEDLVDPVGIPDTVKVYGIPATRIAEDLGRRVVLNMVMLGFFAAVTNAIKPFALFKAVETTVPKGTEALNLKAFDRGFEYGRRITEGDSYKPE